MLNVKTREKEILEMRIEKINSIYSAFDALTESGLNLQDENTSEQVLCPYHEDKNKPSARYYAPSGRTPGHFFCFKCRLRLDSVGIYSRYKRIKFMDALKGLERRYNITPPKLEDQVEISFTDRSGGYESEEWKNVERVLDLCESKLSRVRSKCSMPEFVRLCRLLDNVRYDWEKSGVKNPDMVVGVNKARFLMDDYMSRTDENELAGLYLPTGT